MRKAIIPSIIAKSQKELNNRINNVKKHVSLIQLDVMDGKFVPNNSLCFNFKLPRTKAKFEAHLMVKNPEKWIKKNYRKVETIIIHYESNNLEESLTLAKKLKKKIGIALNPRTKIEKIIPYLNKIDQVLILTVIPGFYGSKFLPNNLAKVRKLRKLKPRLKIEVDGGISPKTIKAVDKAGANLFISGSYTVDSENPAKALKTLKSLLSK